MPGSRKTQDGHKDHEPTAQVPTDWHLLVDSPSQRGWRRGWQPGSGQGLKHPRNTKADPRLLETVLGPADFDIAVTVRMQCMCHALNFNQQPDPV